MQIALVWDNIHDPCPVRKVISKVILYCPKEHLPFCISFGNLKSTFIYLKKVSVGIQEPLLTNVFEPALQFYCFFINDYLINPLCALISCYSIMFLAFWILLAYDLLSTQNSKLNNYTETYSFLWQYNYSNWFDERLCPPFNRI